MKALSITIAIITVLIHNHAGTGIYNQKASLKKWGYVAHYSLRSGKNRNRILRLITSYDIISITGFSLNSRGSIKQKIRPIHLRKIKHFIGRRNIAVYPLINFTSVSAGKRVLSRKKLRGLAAESIRRLVLREKFQGIQIDFEYLPPDYNSYLCIFLFDLRNMLPGTTITMAVFPQVEFPPQWAGFHNIQNIAPLLDEIVIMCYDLHRKNTTPGPVVDVVWAKKNIEYAIRHTLPGKIWLGIPAYGYAWCSNGSFRAISSRYGVKQARLNRGKRHLSGTLHFYFTSRDGKCEAYISDSITRSRLKELAKIFRLRGTALWRIGFEDN